MVALISFEVGFLGNGSCFDGALGYHVCSSFFFTKPHWPDTAHPSRYVKPGPLPHMASGSVAKKLLKLKLKRRTQSTPYSQKLLGVPLFPSAFPRRFPAAEELAAEKKSWDDEIAEMRKRIKEAAAQSLTSSADSFIYDGELHGIEAAFEIGQRSQKDASKRLADLKARHAEAVAKAIGDSSSSSSP